MALHGMVRHLKKIEKRFKTLFLLSFCLFFLKLRFRFVWFSHIPSSNFLPCLEWVKKIYFGGDLFWVIFFIHSAVFLLVSTHFHSLIISHLTLYDYNSLSYTYYEQDVNHKSTTQILCSNILAKTALIQLKPQNLSHV